jgi:S-adenosylmethionine:tRNA ribosyltransferase-isomerase
LFWDQGKNASERDEPVLDYTLGCAGCGAGREVSSFADTNSAVDILLSTPNMGRKRPVAAGEPGGTKLVESVGNALKTGDFFFARGREEMEVSLYHFDLPKELIAQTPTRERSASRLMVLDRKTGKVTHARFPDLLNYLQSGDVLVLNDSRVRPARLIGVKEETGAKIELLLLKPLGEDRWEALVKPAKRVKEGTVIRFGDGELNAVAEEATEVAGGRVFRLVYEEEDVEKLFERLGEMPLPPYIRERIDDPERYQTVYSRAVGSAAAPTAGLHFTPELLEKVREKGVDVAFITLHVGLGTFRPVTAERVEDHHMHAEYYEVSEEAAVKIRAAKERGGRIVAVGTTSVRTLETVAGRFDGEIRAASGWTDIFIYPGYRFRAVDCLLTNFHLPQSTLLMLVSAFATREMILAAYEEAVQERYRFFSFGDAMLIL